MLYYLSRTYFDKHTNIRKFYFLGSVVFVACPFFAPCLFKCDRIIMPSWSEGNTTVHKEHNGFGFISMPLGPMA